MSTQKRIFSLLLSFVMIFSIITSAGITSFASGKPSFVIDVSDAYVGEEVEIKVSAVNMAGLEAADLVFYFDNEYLEFVSLSKCSDLNTYWADGGHSDYNKITFSFFWMNSATKDSGICNIRFKVLKEGTTTISLKVKNWDGTEVPDDAEFEVTNQAKDGSLPFTYEIVDGEVTITGCDTSISGELIIPETIEGYPVTTIGAGTFGSCASLESITIPERLTTIEHHAFYGCTALKSIIIPDSVTIIDYYAFAYCSSLESITIPDSVITIGEYAFGGCSSLTSITIPESVTTIGNGVFPYCRKLTEILVDSKNNNYCSDDGVLFNKDKTEIIAYPCAKPENSYIIPESVTKIGNSAFCDFCVNLESITIPANITTIDRAVFGCLSLTNIIINNPDCEIYDSEYTIYSGATIYGYANSTAQAYAEKYDREFVSIGHEHSYTSKATAPTCTAKGYTTYTCDCGDSYKSNYKNANGHNYSAATCTKAKTCKTCSATSGKANGHNYSAATCTKAKTCKTCGVTSGKANGHKYSNVVTKATLTKSGKIVNKCSVCGNVSKTTTVYYPKTIKLSATSYTYDGKAKTPSVTVKDSAGKTLKNGTDYTVTYASGRKSVGQYKVTVTFKGNYSGTKTLTFNILPGKTSKITVTPATTSLKATWNKVTGATGYKVELLNSSGKVVKSATTTKLTYTFSKLTAGTNYKVKVTAYKTISGKNQYSTVSTTLATATKPATPTLKVTSTKKGVANFTWTNVAGENGYEVYYSASKSSGFKSLASYKTNVAKGSKSKLTSKKTYYFKVRAFKTVNGKKVYGDWSKVVSVKIK